MRTRSLAVVFGLMFALASCGPVPTATPTPGPTATPAPPTPTALAEGYSAGLAPGPAPELGCLGDTPWFFANPARECPRPVLFSATAWQSFERGIMVWSAEGGRTYVMLDDGAPLKPYFLVWDTSGTGMPQPDPNIVPPPGFYQPELGFAKFWRGLAPGSEWVREALGWATAPEAAYSGMWQCNAAGDESARCYFTGPRDEVIALSNGAGTTWTYVQGPMR